MPSTIFSSRECNQDAARAKETSRKRPVFITDRGRTAHVLLSIREYQTIASPKSSIAELLRMSETDDFNSDPPKLTGRLFRRVDLL